MRHDSPALVTKSVDRNSRPELDGAVNVHELPERRSLIEGRAWDAVVAAVVAEAEMAAELAVEAELFDAA
jgi:hypothetical protein